MSRIVTEVLDLACSRQKARVTSNVTSVTFTEGRFRTSDLYDLNRVVTQTYLHLNIKLTQQYCSTPSVSVSHLKKGVFVS